MAGVGILTRRARLLTSISNDDDCSLGDVINDWRRKSLGLENIPASMGPGITTHLKVPHTYCWSPAIMPKPADWGPEIGMLPERMTLMP